MEALSKQEIARHLGLDESRVRGTQDWVPDTHPHLVISQLVLNHRTDPNDVEIHPFRVRDRLIGKVHTRIDGENDDHVVDHAKVKALHDDTLTLNRKKNLEIVPEVLKAIPELDPDSAAHVRIGSMIYDLVDGRLQNGREPAQLPRFVASGGEIVVDASDMADHHQRSLAAALRGKHKVIAPRAKG